MKNKNSIDPQKINQLLNMAGKQFGVAPQALRRQLENRDFHSLQNGLTPQQQKELNSLLSDPKKIQQLVNSPELNSLLNKIR